MPTATVITEQVSLSARQGQRVYAVTGLDSTRGEAMMADALKTSGIPAVNSRHPYVDGLYSQHPTVTEIAYADGTAFVSVPYSDIPADDGTPTLAFGSIIEMVETQRDAAGSPLRLTWSPYKAAGSLGPASPGDGPGGNGAVFERIGTARMPVPRRTLTVRRKVYDIRDAERLAAIVGKVNADRWLAPTGSLLMNTESLPDTWLCTRATSGEATRTAPTATANYGPFTMSLEFAYNPDTWNPVVVVIDPTTGQPIGNLGKIQSNSPESGLSIGNGIRVFRVSERANFGSLELFRKYVRPSGER
jgi:hypothetical protein